MGCCSCLFAAVFVLVLFRLWRGRGWARRKRSASERARLMVVLGSGGHTAEMLTMMKGIDLKKYSPLVFIVAETDKISVANAQRSDALQCYPKEAPTPKFVKIPRAREVGQSWASSMWTTLVAFLFTLRTVAVHRPELVLCNGPGTCIPIVFSALLFRLLGIRDCKIVFIESFARVQSLSLSGKILVRVVDRFVVQWPQLLDRCHGAATFSGVLC